MDEICINSTAIVTSDGPCCCKLWVSRSTEVSHLSHSISTLEDHSDDWSIDHVVYDLREVRLICMMSIVVSADLLSQLDELERDDLKSFVFESSDDIPNKASRYGVRLEKDDSSFCSKVCLVIRHEKRVKNKFARSIKEAFAKARRFDRPKYIQYHKSSIMKSPRFFHFFSIPFLLIGLLAAQSSFAVQ